MSTTQSWETKAAWSELITSVDSSHLMTPSNRKLNIRCETNIYTLYRGAAEVELQILDDNYGFTGGKVSPTTDQRGGINRGDPDNSALTGSSILLLTSVKDLLIRLMMLWLLIALLS